MATSNQVVYPEECQRVFLENYPPGKGLSVKQIKDAIEANRRREGRPLDAVDVVCVSSVLQGMVNNPFYSVTTTGRSGAKLYYWEPRESEKVMSGKASATDLLEDKEIEESSSGLLDYLVHCSLRAQLLFFLLLVAVVFLTMWGFNALWGAVGSSVKNPPPPPAATAPLTKEEAEEKKLPKKAEVLDTKARRKRLEDKKAETWKKIRALK